MKAGLIYGWKITKELYDSFPDKTHAVDCGQGDYFIGEIIAETTQSCPYYDYPIMSSELYNLIEKTFPTLIYALPNPTLYLYHKEVATHAI